MQNRIPFGELCVRLHGSRAFSHPLTRRTCSANSKIEKEIQLPASKTTHSPVFGVELEKVRVHGRKATRKLTPFHSPAHGRTRSARFATHR